MIIESVSQWHGGSVGRWISGRWSVGRWLLDLIKRNQKCMFIVLKPLLNVPVLEVR